MSVRDNIMMNTTDRELLISSIRAKHGSENVSRKQILSIVEEHNLSYPAWILNERRLKVGRGLFDLTEMFQGNAVKKAKSRQHLKL